MPTNHLLYTFAAAIVAVAFSTAASAQTVGKKPATCIVVGKEVQKTKDMTCPQDVVGTLRSHFYEYEVPKKNKKGEMVLDKKGDVVMEKRRKTYRAMADLIEAVGLKKAFGKRLVTVFAVPDSVLMPALKDLNALLKDKKRKQQVFAAIAMHVTDEALMAEWFRSKNGRMWTFAGSWSSGAAPLSFYALRDHTTVEINDIPLMESDIVASNGVIHTVDSPLVALPKPAKMANKKM